MGLLCFVSKGLRGHFQGETHQVIGLVLQLNTPQLPEGFLRYPRCPGAAAPLLFLVKACAREWCQRFGIADDMSAILLLLVANG